MGAPAEQLVVRSLGNGETRVWDERYAKEVQRDGVPVGHLWGDEPSQTARQVVILLGVLHEFSKDRSTGDRRSFTVVDIGCGYGRDEAYFIKNSPKIGYLIDVKGVDRSPVGLRMAESTCRGLRDSFFLASRTTGNFHPILADFATGQCTAVDRYFGDKSVSAVLSHRVIHTEQKPDRVARIANRARRILVPGGFLVVTARHEDDINSGEMTHIGKGVYEYIKRPGHTVRPYTEKSIVEAFPGFRVHAVFRSEEIESLTNPRMTELVTLVAQRPVNDLS